MFGFGNRLCDEVYGITDDVRSWCREFAARRSPGFYVRTRGASPEKARRDIMIGQIAKVYGHRFLVDNGVDVTDVDFSIHDRQSKGWRSYLSGPGGRRIHIKGCTSVTAKTCGESWTFQASDFSGRGGRDAVYDYGDDSDLYLFIFIDEAKNTVRVRALVSWSFIRGTGLLKHPVHQGLMGMKQVVYYQDLADALEVPVLAVA